MLKSLQPVISFLAGCTNHSFINQEAVSPFTTPIAHSLEQAIQLASGTTLSVDRVLFPGISGSAKG